MTTVQVQPHSFAVQNYSDSFFTNQPTDRRFESSKYHAFFPVNSWKNSSQINFYLPKWPGRTIWDLGETMVAVKIKLTDAKGAKVPDLSKVAPVNNMMHSAFSDFKMYLSNVLITPNSMNYGYKKYFENVLSYNSDSKLSVLQGQGYYEDTPGAFNNMDGEANIGFKNRMERFCQVNANGKPINYNDGTWLVGKLGCDLDHHIIGGIDVRLEFTLQKPEWYLNYALAVPPKVADFRFEVDKIVVFPMARVLTPPVFEKIEELFKTKGEMVLPFRRREVVPYNIPVNSTNFLSGMLHYCFRDIFHNH